MKEIIIIGCYFLSMSSIAGMITFLIYQNKSGWGWLVFILFLMLNLNIKVK